MLTTDFTLPVFGKYQLFQFSTSYLLLMAMPETFTYVNTSVFINPEFDPMTQPSSHFRDEEMESQRAWVPYSSHEFRKPAVIAKSI